ncbi:MAG: hypothetical protein ACREDJ_08460, partial [Methylocella sp.]
VPPCAARRAGSHWLKEDGRMQGIAAGLFWTAILVLPDLASAKPDEVPRFDVARSCQEARAYTGDDKNLAYRGCMKDENEARAELARKWARFKPGDRKDCVAQGAAPAPSYVEILTCLEMSDEAEALYNPDGTLRDKPQGAAAQGKSGQDQAPPSGAAPAPESGGGNKPD